MSQPFYRCAVIIRVALIVLASLMVASCGSPEERAQSYYESGMKLLAAHNTEKAALEFRNAVRLQKNFLPAWRGLAQTEEAIHHWDGLVPVLQTIVDLDPKDEATRLKLARLLLAGGAADQALKLVNGADEPDANDANLLGLKAAISYKLKDYDSAIRNAQAAIKIEPENVDALIVLAADRLANNDPQGALQLLSSDALTQKNDLGVQLFKIKLYEKLKDYSQLETLLRSVAEAHPQDVAFRKELVELYMFQHRPQDAEKELRAISAADPKNSQAGLDLVRFLYSARGPQSARDELVARINAGGDIFTYQLALAEFDYDQGKVDDSFKSLQALANSASSANAVKAKTLLAALNLRQKNTDAAEKIVADILANDEGNVDALKLRASIRLSRNEFDAAISDLRQALNAQPRSQDLMLMLATAYEKSGSIDLADKQFADALKSSKYAANVGLDYVAFLRRRGGSNRAYDVLTELAKRWPNNIQVLSGLAQAKLARQDWVGAQQSAEAIKRIGNTGGIADQILGSALAGEHKYDESIAAFQSALAAAPSAVQPMTALVGALVSAKQTDKAIAFLQNALKENPNNAEAYVLLGDVELANGTPDQAEKHFKKAIENQPKSDIGYHALADLYLRRKDADAALSVIRTGLKELPDSATLHLTLASTLELKADYEGAISEYEYLLKQQPGSMVIVNNLASLLADHRTDPASLTRAQSLAATLRESPVPQFKDTLGWVYYRQGDFKAAAPLLEIAAAAMPDGALVHYHLGMDYVGIGQLAKASDQLKEALNLAPDSDLEAKIKAGLKNIVTQ